MVVKVLSVYKNDVHLCQLGVCMVLFKILNSSKLVFLRLEINEHERKVPLEGAGLISSLSLFLCFVSSLYLL